ncbi:MAG: plastocyanin/azurin family copper-binding protein [Candidatus Zixiibacteriota bacterium]
MNEASLRLRILYFALWMALAPGCIAGVVTGRVERPPSQPATAPQINRYRGPETAAPKTSMPNCSCEPQKFAVVYLTGDSLPPVLPVATHPSMAQKDMMFQPSVLAVTVGSSVEFPNFDPYFHNVFSYSKTKKFDLGRYAIGKSKSIVFDKPGIVKIFCEIHNSMRAYLHVLETPYFTVSDDQGVFTISDIKQGDYTLHVWQENQSDLEQTITVVGDTTQVAVR